MKGGKVCEVISGKRKGKYAQVPNDKQHQVLLDAGKVYAEYFEDRLGQVPVMDDGIPLTGITNFANLKIIGFYD